MASEWTETSLGAVMDVKHGFAFPGERIRDEPPGDILLTPGNFAIGGGFKGDKFKYFDGEVPEDYVLKAGDLVLTMTDLSKQADTLGYPAIVPKPRGPRFRSVAFARQTSSSSRRKAWNGSAFSWATLAAMN